MHHRRPRVAVFFGGETGNHARSQATGWWACQYIPRDLFDVTPVRITPEGLWQVPLGHLPRSGNVQRMLEMLLQAVPALPPAQALPRLMNRPPAAMMTVVRGKNGDDGAIQQLGAALGSGVVGSPAAACVATSDKGRCVELVQDIVPSPRTVTYHPDQPIDETVAETQKEFQLPVLIKPLTQEGSVGIEYVDQPEGLGQALERASQSGDALIQEKAEGTEVTITLFQDSRGVVRMLPPTAIVLQKAPYYDALAKEREGRVRLVTPAAEVVGEHVLAVASAIAREVYETLGCQDMVSIDFFASENGIDILDVNTVPVMGKNVPLYHQLAASKLEPSHLLRAMVQRAVEQNRL